MILFSLDRIYIIQALPEESDTARGKDAQYEWKGVKADSARIEAGPGCSLVQGGDSERRHSTRRDDCREQARPEVGRRHSAGARGADRAGTSRLRAESPLQGHDRHQTGTARGGEDLP